MALGAFPLEKIVEIGSEAYKGETAAALLLNHIQNNGVPRPELVESLLKIFGAACDIGHNKWPLQIRDIIKGKSLLDVGCGSTFYGAVLRALGATSYLGVDPRVDLARNTFRSRIKKGSVKLDLNLSAVVAAIEHVEFQKAFPQGRTFDLALLHTVTEHLEDVAGTFAAIADSLQPNGRMWFLHDNFYGWSGHHLEPHSIASFDPANEEHLKYADWNHIGYAPAPDHIFSTGLNRIRIDDLKAITSEFFDILSWDEVAEKDAIKRRLDNAILERRAEYTARELLTKHVICLAQVRRRP